MLLFDVTEAVCLQCPAAMKGSPRHESTSLLFARPLCTLRQTRRNQSALRRMYWPGLGSVGGGEKRAGILSCWRETKGRTIHEQGPTPVSDRPRFAGPERGPHCRQATADRLLMSSRPGQQVMTSSWSTTDANIILCPTDEFYPHFECKSIYASRIDLYHNAVAAPSHLSAPRHRLKHQTTR